ncbi:MAG: hypothetical protein RR942_19095 [Romboutsia sp.]
MCLFSYNNKIQTNNVINNEEHELLNKIYQCISCDDKENAKLLTSQLIALQSSKENIDVLQDAINKLH